MGEMRINIAFATLATNAIKADCAIDKQNKRVQKQAVCCLLLTARRT